ncbi:MAG: hypothetical protein NXI23_10520 [Bacteroidetes bacterium]|jgi:hypothetical protein|nr:hypothetical protein [Bacteroidota bacterium]
MCKLFLSKHLLNQAIFIRYGQLKKRFWDNDDIHFFVNICDYGFYILVAFLLFYEPIEKWLNEKKLRFGIQ